MWTTLDYKKLTEQPISLIRNGHGLSMPNHNNPISVTEKEFYLMREIAESYNVRYGYEIATGFGVSALAVAPVFHKNKGTLVSMDAYIEEQYNDYTAYRQIENQTYQDSDGFKTASKIMETYGYSDAVKLTCGWSPSDTENNIRQHIDLNTNQLDYIFIDGGHWDEQIHKDLSAVLPFVNRKNALIMFHDMPGLGNSTMSLLEKEFGKTPSLLYTEYNLGFMGIS